jgi:GT2 family glycosyltransferase
MPKRVDISVVLISYNVKQYLEQALDSIFKALSGMASEVFVVDNGSGDGSVSMVKKRFPRVRLIQNTDNVGFARANNQALSLVQGEIVCLINPDTLVREDTFKTGFDYLKHHPDVGALGCKILNPDGTLQLACRRSFPTPGVAAAKILGLSRLFPKSRIFGRYNLTYLDPDKIHEVEALSGSFMMVRKRAVDQAGFLDEDFFLYGEDLDWCYRIKQKGWKIVYFPLTQIVHYKGRSTQEASIDSLRMFYGAMRLFVKKHFRSGWSFLPQWFLIVGIGLRWAVSFLSRSIRRLAVPFVDLVLMQVSLVLSLLIRFGDLSYYGYRYQPVDVVYSLVWLICLYLMGSYDKGVFSAAKAIGATVIGSVVNASLTYFFPKYAYSRQVLLMAGFFNLLFLSGWRLGIRFLSRIRYFPFLGTVGRTLARRRAVVVGTGRASRRIYDRLLRQIDAGYDLAGLLALDEREIDRDADQDHPVLGTLRDIARISQVHRIRSVIFSPETVSYERILNLVAESKHLQVDFKMVPRDLDVIVGRTSVDSLEDIPLVSLDYKLLRGSNRFLKRLADIAVSAFLAPLVLCLIVFFQLHPGYRFDRFWIHDGFGGKKSLRLLKKNGNVVHNRAASLLLLRYVFPGTLSLVGDDIRPVDAAESVVRIKPGLTGLIQIHADRHLSKEDREKYRLYYLKNYSLLLDLEILIRTLFR